MAKRLIDFDPFTGVKIWHDYDPVTDETTIATEQECAPILEANKAIQGVDDYSKKGIQNEWWHVASIPLGLIEKWKKEEGIDVFNSNHDPAMWRRVKRKLMDPEYRYLRTGVGRL